MSDKNKEIKRYDLRASMLLDKEKIVVASNDKPYLMDAYESYQNLFKNIPEEYRILEIGAGMGENTTFLLKYGLNVVASDISSKSIEVMRRRFKKYKNFKAKHADMEALPFDNCSFDIVCSAGSLSYGDNKLVMNEIYRVLDKGGSFIAVDSLNDNPVYKLNRYIHFIRGNRSKSTIKRMPNLNLIKDYEKKFGSINVNYYGSITWLFPFLKLILKDFQLKYFSSWFDKNFKIKSSAFKFVMKVTKI